MDVNNSPPQNKPRLFYGWYIVLAGMGIHLWVSIVWIYGMQLFFTPLVQTFGWSRAAISGAFGLQRLEGSIATPLIGLLLDRSGAKIIVIAGAFITGVGLIFMSFMNALWMFYVGVLLVSLGTAACSGNSRNWAIVQWFRRLRGRALGIGSSGAVLSGPLLIIVVWLLSTFGWRVAFFIIGLLTWIICIPLATVFRSRPQDSGYLPDGDVPVNHENVSRSQGSNASINNDTQLETSMSTIEALKSSSFWILTLIFGAQTMGVSGLNVHLIPYLETIGFTPGQGASVLAFYTVLSAFGRLGGGWAMDYLNPKTVLASLLICLSISLVILANLNSYWLVFPFALLYGTAFGGMLPARSGILSFYFGPKNFGAINGLAQSATILTGVLSPVLMGFVFDITGSYEISFYIIAAISIFSVPFAFIAKPPTNNIKPDQD
ncbi:MAG: MFS transporter [Dehalococcoidia bacterium]|nr:MFS transporter [Dehalococcoidia bacterium]